MKFLLFLILLFLLSCNKAFDYQNPYKVKKEFITQKDLSCLDDSDCAESKINKKGYYCDPNTNKCINPCNNYSCSENKECSAYSYDSPYCDCKKEYYKTENNECISYKWLKVSASDSATCAIVSFDKNNITSGKLYCWGRMNDLRDISHSNSTKNDNRYIILNFGEKLNIPNVENVKDVSSSSNRICAIDQNNKLHCLLFEKKDNQNNQNKGYDIILDDEIENIDKEFDFVYVNKNKESNSDTFCAITTNNELYCNYNDKFENKEADSSFKKVDLSGGNIIAINIDGILQSIIGNENHKPQDKTGKYKCISFYNGSLLTINESDRLYKVDMTTSDINENKKNSGEICHSSLDNGNSYNAIQTGCDNNTIEPLFIASNDNNIFCFIEDRADNNLYCMTNINLDGNEIQIISDKIIFNEQQNTFKQLGTNHKWKQVSVGGDYLCAIDDNDKLFCLGNNSETRLGIDIPQKDCSTKNLEQLFNNNDNIKAYKLENRNNCYTCLKKDGNFDDGSFCTDFNEVLLPRANNNSNGDK